MHSNVSLIVQDLFMVLRARSVVSFICVEPYLLPCRVPMRSPLVDISVQYMRTSLHIAMQDRLYMQRLGVAIVTQQPGVHENAIALDDNFRALYCVMIQKLLSLRVLADALCAEVLTN